MHHTAEAQRGRRAGAGRTLRFWLHLAEAVLEAMEERLARRPELMQIRRSVVEHVFGTIKSWMGSTHFLTRGRSERQDRDQPAGARLQSEAGNQHRRDRAPDDRDQGPLSLTRLIIADQTGRAQAWAVPARASDQWTTLQGKPAHTAPRRARADRHRTFQHSLSRNRNASFRQAARRSRHSRTKHSGGSEFPSRVMRPSARSSRRRGPAQGREREQPGGR